MPSIGYQNQTNLFILDNADLVIVNFLTTRLLRPNVTTMLKALIIVGMQ